METGSGGGLRAALMGTEGWWLLLCLALSGAAGAAVDTGEWDRLEGSVRPGKLRTATLHITQGERSQSLLSPRGGRLSG